MDFNPAYNVSRQRIKTAKYTTTTFAYHSTTYLFNDDEDRAGGFAEAVRPREVQL